MPLVSRCALRLCSALLFSSVRKRLAPKRRRSTRSRWRSKKQTSATAFPPRLNSRTKRKERSKCRTAQTIRQRSYSYQKTGKRKRCGKKTRRRFRGATLKISLSSRKLPIASAFVLILKKTINCPKTLTH